MINVSPFLLEVSRVRTSCSGNGLIVSLEMIITVYFFSRAGGPPHVTFLASEWRHNNDGRRGLDLDRCPFMEAV